MKHISIKMGFFGLSALFLISCAAPEENLDTFAENTVEYEKADKATTVHYEITVKDQQHEDPKISSGEATKVEENVTAPVSPVVPPAEYPDMIKKSHEVAPWLANYVGSYGVLPTRYAKEGPFLYSLPVRPHTDRHLAGAVEE